MASFTELPPEIHLLIAEHLADQRAFKSIAEVSQSSKRVHHIYEDKLYQAVSQTIKVCQKDFESPSRKWGHDYSFVEQRVPSKMIDITEIAATATRIKKLMGYYGWASGNLAVYFLRVLLYKTNVREKRREEEGQEKRQSMSQGERGRLVEISGLLTAGIRKAFESELAAHSGEILPLDKQPRLIRKPENDKNWKNRLQFLYSSAEETTCPRTMEHIVDVLDGVHIGRNQRWKWAKKVVEKGSKSLLERYVKQGGFILHTVQHKRRYTSLVSLALKALRKIPPHDTDDDSSTHRRRDTFVWKQELEERASVVGWLLENQCAGGAHCQTCAFRDFTHCGKFGRITSDTTHGVLLYLFCMEESGGLQILLDQGNNELVIYILRLLTELLDSAEVDLERREPSQYKNALSFFARGTSSLFRSSNESRSYLQPLSFVLYNWDRLFDKTGRFSRTALLNALLQKAYPPEFQLKEMVDVIFSPSNFEEDGVDSSSNTPAEERPISITNKLFFVLPLDNWHCKISSTRDQIRLGQLLLQYGADIHESTYPITPFQGDTFARVLYRNRKLDILEALLGPTWRDCIHYDDKTLATHREYMQNKRARDSKRMGGDGVEPGFRLVPKVRMEFIYEMHHFDSPHDDQLEMPGYESP